jgi:hypothetical protein
LKLFAGTAYASKRQQLTFVRTMSYRQRIASIREFDGGRTLRWFGVLAACAAFWLVIVWAGLRFI